MGVWENFFTKAKSLFSNQEPNKKLCYYEILNVDKNATNDEIKQAYKKMALKWHPDKNPDRLEECTAFFVVLQQAYEILSNPQERAFYDRHRDNIIFEGLDEKKDTGIDLTPYFDKNCFSGYSDDPKGFYAVYSNLFHKISAEEYFYIENMDERNFPIFGNSKSTYEMIVEPFYSFWMVFSTRRSFNWLNEYDIRQAGDRATLRAMEKKNMRLRNIGKKQRSEEIQRLVLHIRKFDKRVKIYRELLKKDNENRIKQVEQNRLSTIRRNLEELEGYVVDQDLESEYKKQLEEIENQLDVEFGTLSFSKTTNDDSEETDKKVGKEYYCVVCERKFTSLNPYYNHIASKKHKQELELLKKQMHLEQQQLLEESLDDENFLEENQKSKTNLVKEKKKTKKKLDEKIVEDLKSEEDCLNKEENTNDSKLSSNEKIINIKKTKKKSKTKSDMKNENTVQTKSSQCENCGEEFESRTKLFTHLNQTGHATLKTITKPVENTSQKKKRRK